MLFKSRAVLEFCYLFFVFCGSIWIYVGHTHDGFLLVDAGFAKQIGVLAVSLSAFILAIAGLAGVFVGAAAEYIGLALHLNAVLNLIIVGLIVIHG